MMVLLQNPPENNVRGVTLSNMTTVVSLNEPSFSRKVSEFDFRAEGFGIIELVGPMQFKWEMFRESKSKAAMSRA